MHPRASLQAFRVIYLPEHPGEDEISLIVSDLSCYPFVDQISALPGIPAATGNAHLTWISLSRVTSWERAWNCWSLGICLFCWKQMFPTAPFHSKLTNRLAWRFYSMIVVVSLSRHINSDSITNGFPCALIITPLSLPGKCICLFFFNQDILFSHIPFLKSYSYIIDYNNGCRPNLYSKNNFCFPGLSTMSLDLFPMGETIFFDVSFDLSLNTPPKNS